MTKVIQKCCGLLGVFLVFAFHMLFLNFFCSNQDQVNISSLLLNRSLVVDVKGTLIAKRDGRRFIDFLTYVITGNFRNIKVFF